MSRPTTSPPVLPRTPGSRAVRIFLSSTFRDFGEERDLLVRRVFPALRARLKDRFVELIDVDLRWGITTEEAERGEVLPICLGEIDRARPYFVGMLGERYGWVPPANAYAPNLLEHQPWLAQHQGGKSVTELEILHGVLNDPAMAGRAYFYFRSRRYARAKAGDYIAASSDDRSRQDELKTRVRASGFPVTRYRDPEALARRLERDLWKLLNAEFPASAVPDAHERESRRHEAYAAPRRRLYLGAQRYVLALDQALTDGAQRVLIEGASGGGKSALLANWLALRGVQHPQELVFEHYLAASADASNPERLVRRLLQTIRRATGSQDEIPSDPQQLFDSITSWLMVASQHAQKVGARWLIAIDAINGLTRLKDLRWFPQELPEHVHVIVSSLPGEVYRALQRKGPWQSIQVRPLQRLDCEALLVAYLRRYNKTLPDELKQRALAHPLAGNPLFLRTLAEELRLFGVHEALTVRLERYLSSTSVPELFIRVLDRVEEDFAPATVRQVLSALWASRSGLREEEIMGAAELVQARWAPLRNALDEMLLDAMGRIGFAHDYMRQAVQARYLPDAQAQSDAHLALARWFAQREPDARRAHEEPYQWQQGGHWPALRDCLLHADMFGAVHQYAGAQELLSYWLALNKSLGLSVESAYETAWPAWQAACSPAQQLELAAQLQKFLAYAGCTGAFALQVSQQGLALSREQLGAEHDDTIERMNRSAMLLKARGDYAQAEALYQQVVQLLEKIGRKGRDRLGTVLVNLAELYRAQGLLEKAQSLARQALSIQEKVKGPWHMSTWLAINNLASILRAQGIYKEAVELHTRALRIVRRRRGFEHKDTSISLNNLGSLFQTLGQKSEAERAFRSALKIREKVLGSDHTMTATSRNNLAVLLKSLGQLDEAESLYRQVMASLELRLPPGHANLGTCANNLGSLLLDRGNTAEDGPWLDRALSIREARLGSDHADVASTLNAQARLMQALERPSEALPLRLRALAILLKKLGPGHRESLTTLERVAQLHEKLGQPDEAEASFKQLLELRQRAATRPEGKALERSRELLAAFYERHARPQDAARIRASAPADVPKPDTAAGQGEADNSS
jgi:tetratricopeptide (TPR) repeat protein